MTPKRRSRTLVVGLGLTVVAISTALLLSRPVREWYWIRQLELGDERSLEAAARALGAMGSMRAIPALLATAELPDGERTASFSALLEIGEPAIPILMEELMKPPSADWGPAYTILGEMGPVIAPEAEKYLRSPRFRHRLRAAWILAVVEEYPDEALPVFAEDLKNSDPQRRSIALTSIRDFGDRATAVLSTLIESLRDPEETLRWQTIDILKSLGPPARQAVPALRELFADPSKMVARAARLAVESLEDE